MKHLIRGCSLDGDSGGLVIEFLTPTTDVRANGLVINHAVLIPPQDAFTDLIDDVEAVLQRALSTALTMFTDAEPLAIATDDSPSPYDNPDER